MKNIHLISTDKESNLYKNLLTDKLFALKNNYLMNVSEANRDNQFIYITNDEYIGLSYYLDGDLVRKGVIDDKDYWDARKDYKKIVLTNDTSLIEDGVQEVPSVFLSFFAENTPDCVEVIKILQTRWGTDWHDLPNQKEGREPEGIYRTVYTLNFPQETKNKIKQILNG